MKNMSYRDKMIVLIISIIIILVAGFFALIRPKYQTLVADNANYETTKTEWDGIKQKLDAIPGLEDNITASYNEANKDASIFVNDAFGDYSESLGTEHVNYLVDEYIQPALDESNLKVIELALGTAGSTELTYYYYTPNVLTYALLEAADINGNYAETATKALQTSAVLEERTAVEALAQNVALNVTGNRENLMAFLEAIKSDENAILVDKVIISDYTFTSGLAVEGEGQPQTQVVEVVETDAEGNEVVTQQEVPVEAAAPTVAEGEGYSAMELSVTFYNAKEIDKPDFGE